MTPRPPTLTQLTNRNRQVNGNVVLRKNLPKFHKDAHTEQQAKLRDLIKAEGGNPDEMPDFMKKLEKPKRER